MNKSSKMNLLLGSALVGPFFKMQSFYATSPISILFFYTFRSFTISYIFYAVSISPLAKMSPWSPDIIIFSNSTCSSFVLIYLYAALTIDMLPTINISGPYIPANSFFNRLIISPSTPLISKVKIMLLF